MKQMTILLFKTVLSLGLTSIYAQTLRSRLSQSGRAATRYEGRLEIYHTQSHSWRPLCDDTFGVDEARVVCFSLGFHGNCSRVVSNSYGPAVDPVLRLNIRCDGSELSLGECRYSDLTDVDAVSAHRCTHSSSHVAVQCRHCHTSAARSRRTSSSTTNTDSDSDSESSTFWMGGLFIFFFFAWVLVVICCIACHCYRRARLPSQGAVHEPSQTVFMTSQSGVDNTAMITNPPDAVPLAGLPSYEDVIAHSDIYKRIDTDTLPSYSAACTPSAPQHDSNQAQPTPC